MGCAISADEHKQMLRVLLRLAELTRPCPSRLLLLALLLPPALGAQLLVAHDAAEALTGTRPAAGAS